MYGVDEIERWATTDLDRAFMPICIMEQIPYQCFNLVSRSGTDNFQTILFVPETDEAELIWRGPGSGVTAAMEIFLADQAFKNSDLKRFLGTLQICMYYLYIIIVPFLGYESAVV